MQQREKSFSAKPTCLYNKKPARTRFGIRIRIRCNARPSSSYYVGASAAHSLIGELVLFIYFFFSLSYTPVRQQLSRPRIDGGGRTITGPSAMFTTARTFYIILLSLRRGGGRYDARRRPAHAGRIITSVFFPPPRSVRRNGVVNNRPPRLPRTDNHRASARSLLLNLFNRALVYRPAGYCRVISYFCRFCLFVCFQNTFQHL